MKALLFVMIMTMSAGALADTKCDQSVLQLADTVMKSRAAAYGFDSQESLLVPGTLTSHYQTTDNRFYAVDANIYKASYTVSIRMDDQCGVKAIIIAEKN